jgi:hypothetical protein
MLLDPFNQLSLMSFRRQNLKKKLYYTHEESWTNIGVLFHLPLKNKLVMRTFYSGHAGVESKTKCATQLKLERPERLARRCRAMTCSPMIGRKVVDILQDFRLWINSLRVYGIS